MTSILNTLPHLTDDYCMRVVDAMRKMHRRGDGWFNANDIAREVGTVGSTHVQAALYRLAAMGFLWMRDGDGNHKFEYQLRKEYRR